MKTKTALAALLIASSATAVGAASFTFSSSGWSNDATFSGSFEGEDLNNDGQLNFFNNEITDFAGTFQTSAFTTTFDFSSLSFDLPGFEGPVEVDNGPSEVPPLIAVGGLVFTLDGNGLLGDDVIGGIEGLEISNGEYTLALGPGPGDLCEQGFPCGGFYNADDYRGFIPFVPFEGLPPNFNSEEPPVNFASTEFLVPPNLIPVEGPLPFGALATTNDAIVVNGDDLGDLGTEGNPFLPGFTNGEDGFVFDVPGGFGPRDIFFIDPDIAIGYTYEVTGNTFTGVQFPTTGAVPDSDGLNNLVVNGLTFNNQVAGSTFDFLANGIVGPVTMFEINGIDAGLALDPTDPMAFVTGVSVANPGVGQIQQTPITAPIPLPAGGVLLFSGLAGLALWRRRRG